MNEKWSFYLYLQKRLLEYCDENNCLSYDDIRVKLSRTKIPYHFIPIFIQEMQKMKLLKKEKRFKFRIINKNNSKKIENLHNVQQLVGLY